MCLFYRRPVTLQTVVLEVGGVVECVGCVVEWLADSGSGGVGVFWMVMYSDSTPSTREVPPSGCRHTHTLHNTSGTLPVPERYLLAGAGIHTPSTTPLVHT